MAATTKLKVEGIDQVVRELERRQGNLRQALEAIVLVGAEVIRQAAASNSDGKIAANMVKEPTSKNPQRIEVGIGPSKAQWYARFTEFGTAPHVTKHRKAKALQVELGTFRAAITHPGTRARPFLRPAFDEQQGAASDAMGAEVSKVLDL